MTAPCHVLVPHLLQRFLLLLQSHPKAHEFSFVEKKMGVAPVWNMVARHVEHFCGKGRLDIQVKGGGAGKNMIEGKTG